MLFSTDCMIADIPFRFMSYEESDFFSTINWKLDPYVTKAAECPQFYIYKNQSEKNAGEGENAAKALLFDEPSGFFNHQVLRGQDGGTIWQYYRRLKDSCYLRYQVSPDLRNVTLLEDHTDTKGTMAFEYLAQLMPSLMLTCDVLTFHGVLMEYKGQGIIISADSGVGKTTHARIWRDHFGALILNGDRSVLRKIDGTWYGYGTPWSGSSGEQINRRVPISAFVSLKRGNVNEAHRLFEMDAFHEVFRGALYPSWDLGLTGKAMDLLDAFLLDIPVYSLQCLPNREAAEVLKREIFTE